MVEEHDRRAYDPRIILYKSVRTILLIIIIGIFVKSCFVDSISVKGNQMSPTLVKGDQILVFRIPFLSVFSSHIKPGLSKPVIFRHPFDQNHLTSLRIAGASGDTVKIDSGIVTNSSQRTFLFPSGAKNMMIVPANFAPRDFFTPYYIPDHGTKLVLDSLSLRDFFFASSIIRQENRKSKVEIKADLFMNGTLSNDYFLNEFSLYKGTIDSIPQNLRFDWFFWDKLKEYLQTSADQNTINLKFSLYMDNTRIATYTVKNSYVFLLADNWGDGLDSRYIGPVQVSAIVGRAFFVLWSFDKDSKPSLKIKRFGRIIR